MPDPVALAKVQANMVTNASSGWLRGSGANAASIARGRIRRACVDDGAVTFRDDPQKMEVGRELP